MIVTTFSPKGYEQYGKRFIETYKEFCDLPLVVYVEDDLKIKGILLTMYDERTNLSKQVEEEIRNFFKSKVYRVIIPRSIRLSEAPGFGKPIQLYDIKSAGSKAYISLAKEILNK